MLLWRNVHKPIKGQKTPQTGGQGLETNQSSLPRHPQELHTVLSKSTVGKVHLDMEQRGKVYFDMEQRVKVYFDTEQRGK